MPRLALHDTDLAYEDTGPGSTGETVVFSHGFLFDLELFRPQIEHLRDRYRIIAWDHRGQGRSADDRRRSIGIELVTDDALALLDRLAPEPVHFVGLSMGGFVGLRIAGRHPGRLRSLALLNTSAEAEPRSNLPRYRALAFLASRVGPARLATRILPFMVGRTTLTAAERAEVRRDILGRIAANGPRATRALGGVLEREGVEHLLPRIQVPTLIVAGEEDVATVPAKAERLRSGIAGSRLVVLERCGHSSALEAPGQVSAALAAHLAAAGAAR
ncbi:MAG: alpha/beta fold hydrolase [Polyangiaceae bacterium]|nr:alpha/beta fold hydrolase [Polyangiaceae bacterium]